MSFFNQPPIGPFSETMLDPEQQWAQNAEQGLPPANAPTNPWTAKDAASPQAVVAPGKSFPGTNPADKLLGFMGGLNSFLEQRQQDADWAALQQKMGRTENMGVNNPQNPFGNYTPNVGLGNNLQPGRQTPVQRPGFERGGELDQFPDGGELNKTQRYMQSFQPGQAGKQEFWQQAIADIDHPLEPGKKLTYGQLQQLLQGGSRKQVLDGYAQQQHLDATPSAEAYLQAQFKQGQERFNARARARPDQYAFPDQADRARESALLPQYLAADGLAQSDVPGQVSNPRIRQQYYASLPEQQSGYAAPGMSQLKRKFEEGGQYTLTHDEIADLRRQGYQVDVLS